MLGNKKLVALCTSRVFDSQIHSFIEILNESLKAHGCNLWIYAINADLYWEEDADMSEATVFDILDWNRLDAVVLMDEKIKSHSVSEKIINKAHSLSMPVVVVDGEYDDTISVSFDYAEGFEQIVRHVIEDHKAQRPHIMAGFKGNKFSDERIDVFKKVIEENGIAFSDDMVSYGEFWVRPARAAAEEILKREVLPDAVICANDIMAINVSDVFMNAGVGVPSDIIVTGFDGYDEALMSVPAITTASCKTNELAYMTAQAVLGCIIGDDTKRYRVIPRVIKNESCGCPRCNENSDSLTKSFNTGFYRHHDDIRRQHTVSARMQSCNSPEELVEVLRDYYMPHVNIIIKNSCFESDRNFFLDDDDQSGFCYFYNSESNDNKIIPFDIDQSHPEFAQSAKNGYPWIFNALDYMNKTMGYICYTYPTYDVIEYSRTAGISNMVSVGLGGYINMKYQQFLMSKVEEMYKIDALTGLYNRIAFHEAFKDMKNDPVMEGRPLSVIMVDLDRLKKINDTLGHDAGDRAIAAVASALKNAVPDNALCVRFGGDEMLSFIPGVERCDEILDSIDDYLGKESEKAGYRIAASCGSYTTTIHPDIDMEQIVKLADEEMYVIKREHREIYSKEDIMFSLRKGVNLGGWMSQCDYSKDRLDNFIKEEDFAVIASWGVDHVRLPVDYNVIQNDDMSINFEGFDRIARAISLAEKNNLKLVIDLHKTPGYSFDKDEGEAGFFENEKLQEQFYLLWEHFAKLFGSKPDTVYFELLNEVTNKEYIDPWNRIWKTCVKRIRAIAPDTPILVGSYYHNAVSTVKFLDKPEEKNVIYNFHCYEPLKFTHQGAHWVDVLDQNARVSFAESGATVEYFEEMFADAIQKSKEDGIPLYCGEYGVIDVAKPEDALEWFKVINAVFEKHGIGRAAWSYRQMDFGLSDARMDKVRDELIKYL